MIDLGIIGGHTIAAGELVRLLINHPDVNIKWVASSITQGKFAKHHKGLLGECELEFSTPNFDDIEVVFCCDSDGAIECRNAMINHPELRVIDLSRKIEGDNTYGLCEINRKFMVHDCYGLVELPTPQAMTALLALVPLAKNMMLNGLIDINLECGSLIPTKAISDLTKEISIVLQALQTGFNSNISITDNRPHDISPRHIAARITVPCDSSINAIKELFTNYYSDHNFTYLSDDMIDFNDVNNTNKCLLNICKEQGMIRINAVADGLLKGGAGNAVHVMNLLFGLHEKVGLALKAQVF